MRLADFLKKRSVELALTLAVALSIIVAGTFAWFSLIQNTTNDFEYVPADLRLVKREAGTERPLAGAVFDLYMVDGEINTPSEKIVHIGRYVTNDKGEIAVNGLDGDKQYYFAEIKPPYGYKNADTGAPDLLKTGGETLVVYNEPIMTTLSIVKHIGLTDLKGEPYTPTEADKAFPFAFTVEIGADPAIEYHYEIKGADGSTFPYDYTYTEGPQKGETIHDVAAAGTLKSGDILYLRDGETASIGVDPISSRGEIPALTAYKVTEKDYFKAEYDQAALDAAAADDDFGCKDPADPTHSKVFGTASGWAGSGDNTVGSLREEGSVAAFENRRVPKDYKITMASLVVVDRILAHPDDIDPKKGFSVTVTVGDDPEQNYWYEVIHPEPIEAVLPDYNDDYEYYDRNDPGVPDPLEPQGSLTAAAERSGFAPLPGSYAARPPLHRPSENERWPRIDGGFQELELSDGNVINVDLHHGSAVIIYGIPVGTHYTAEQVDYRYIDGYMIDSTVKTDGAILPDLDVLEDPDTDDPTLLRVRADIYNYFVRPIMKTITITKTWDHTGNSAPPPESLGIDVIDININSGLVYDSRTLTKLENWTASVTVPKYDPVTGKLIYYDVVERLPPDYVLSGKESTESGFILTNTYAQAMIKPSVQKIVEGDAPPEKGIFTFELEALTQDAPMPAGGNTVSILGEGTAFFGNIRFTEAGTYNYLIRERSGGLAGYRYDTAAYALTVKVTKNENGKLTAAPSYSKGGRTVSAPLVFKNHYTNQLIPGAVGSLTVTKRVTGEGADHDRKFDFSVRLGDIIYRIALADGERYTFTDIPVGTRYTVEETGAEGYITATSASSGVIKKDGSTADFLNAAGCPPNTERGSLTVKKTVAGTYLDATKRFRFVVRLGEAEYELYLRHGESKTFVGIPVGTPYEVVEDDYSAENYVSTRTGAAGAISAGGAVAAFENRYDGPEPPPPADDAVRLSGQKTWDHGESPEAGRPQEITVYVMNGSTIAVQKTVTAAEGWRYTFQLPKYDSTGAPIVYSVSEAGVEHYTLSVKGYNLTNTYTGGTPPDGAGDGPRTGDDSNLRFWVALLAAATAALAWVVFPRRYEGKRVTRRRPR